MIIPININGSLGEDEKQPNVNVCFTAPPALADRIKQNADDCGIKVSEFLRVAIKAYMDGVDEEANYAARPDWQHDLSDDLDAATRIEEDKEWARRQPHTAQ